MDDEIDLALAHVVGAGAMALAAILAGKPDKAEEHLLAIPRSQRSNLKIALDDLDMALTRLGNR